MKTGGAYEIIRSTDPEFLVYDHLPDLLYVPEKDSYKFEDDLSSLKEGTTVYYRVRRSESGTKWAWEERRETAVPIKVTTVLTPDTVQLVEGPDGPVATTPWEPHEGVWLDGTNLSPRRLNPTRGTPPALIQFI